MCGIAGIVSLDGPREFTPGDIIGLSDTLKHRGPDDEGFLLADGETVSVFGGESTPPEVMETNIPYCPRQRLTSHSLTISNSGLPTPNYQLCLIHRRLSIIDTSAAGHQPLCNKEKDVWIIFNGEIYNYPELRQTLVSRGHHFQTQTDTEVLLNAYKEWGTDCVNEFNGMWSFVIYDQKKNMIWGSRDRTGVKPFYYYNDKHVFAFASEIKALANLSFYKKKINEKAAFDFLVFNRIERMDESLFSGIFELAPAHSFMIDLSQGKIKKRKYFSPEVNDQFEPYSETKSARYASEIRALVTEAIRIRLRSDVPVGSCLSGGIDSSSVVCVINDLLKNEKNIQVGEFQKVFTSSFSDPGIDESKWAKIVVDKTRAQWYQTFPEKNKLLRELETLVFCQEIPFISTSTYAQFCVMRLAKENGVKVLLDGQGGDELFGGYRFHYFGKWMELFSHLKLAALLTEMGFYKGAYSHFLKNISKYVVLPQLPPSLLNHIYPIYFNELKYLNKDFLAANAGQYYNNADVYALTLNQMLKKEYFEGPLKNLLKYEDRNSMHFSIEARTPFADDIQLSKKLFSIPSQYKIHAGVSKALLRKAMNGIIPDAIRDRKDKMGFVTPNNQWITAIKDPVRQYFAEDKSGIMNTELLLKDYDSFMNPSSPVENYRLYKFISFAMWTKVFGM